MILERLQVFQSLIFEGSLEVKLPTIWTDERRRWEESERREEQKREDAGARKGRKVARTLLAPPTPPKKQQCKNQECLASDKKKLIACARVRCKRRVDSVPASPREYLVRRAAKNVISPPKTPQNPRPSISRGPTIYIAPLSSMNPHSYYFTHHRFPKDSSAYGFTMFYHWRKPGMVLKVGGWQSKVLRSPWTYEGYLLGAFNPQVIWLIKCPEYGNKT